LDTYLKEFTPQEQLEVLTALAPFLRIQDAAAGLPAKEVTA
jgi:hypothetical protein